MGQSGVNGVIVLIILFSMFSFYVFAAGGGGGGGISSGLGFGSRDSIFILVSQDYSEKFSLKNRTKYELKINIENSTATVTFGNYYLRLNVGDNFLDLNDNNLADINFNLVKVNGKRADVRIINAKDKVVMNKEESIDFDKIVLEEENENIEKEQEDEILCGNLPTINNRVSCRLDLDKEEQKDELEIYFMPEECRVLSDDKKKNCINRYQSVQPCWLVPLGVERVSCVTKILNLGNIENEKQSCNNLNVNNKEFCMKNLKNKVYNLIKWRFYDLEERAEDLMLRGLANRESVIDFVSKTELNKVSFNNVKTKEERKDIILDVRNDWNEFVQIVRENVKE